MIFIIGERVKTESGREGKIVGLSGKSYFPYEVELAGGATGNYSETELTRIKEKEETMKFQVGDIVQVVGWKGSSTVGDWNGLYGKVTSIESNLYSFGSYVIAEFGGVYGKGGFEADRLKLIAPAPTTGELPMLASLGATPSTHIENLTINIYEAKPRKFSFGDSFNRPYSEAS